MKYSIYSQMPTAEWWLPEDGGGENWGFFSGYKVTVIIRLISPGDWLYNIGHIVNIGCSLKDSRSLAICSYH